MTDSGVHASFHVSFKELFTEEVDSENTTIPICRIPSYVPVVADPSVAGDDDLEVLILVCVEAEYVVSPCDLVVVASNTDDVVVFPSLLRVHVSLLVAFISV